jgi:dsDNA-specific endonuclease/ATPase MutS2
MRARFSAGDAVQTPLGKGVVREVRNNRYLVDVKGRSLLVKDADLRGVEDSPRKGRPKRTDDRGKSAAGEPASTRSLSREVDLHGFTVDEAIARAIEALNDALLADVSELRFIHGRSGGRIREALHRRFRHMSPVRSIRLDPRNDGVTVVAL